jgi:RimJ/RimL family protein N-acetyltransferase
MKYFPKIVGEKVYLSPLNPEDYELFTKWMNDPNITDGTGATSFMTTLSSEKKWVEEMVSKSDIYIFSIIRKQDHQILGNIDLREIQRVHRCAMLGILI